MLSIVSLVRLPDNPAFFFPFRKLLVDSPRLFPDWGAACIRNHVFHPPFQKIRCYQLRFPFLLKGFIFCWWFVPIPLFYWFSVLAAYACKLLKTIRFGIMWSGVNFFLDKRVEWTWSPSPYFCGHNNFFLFFFWKIHNLSIYFRGYCNLMWITFDKACLIPCLHINLVHISAHL